MSYFVTSEFLHPYFIIVQTNLDIFLKNTIGMTKESSWIIPVKKNMFFFSYPA